MTLTKKSSIGKWRVEHIDGRISEGYGPPVVPMENGDRLSCEFWAIINDVPMNEITVSMNEI